MSVVCSYSEIFFLKKWWISLIMMALTFINPYVGVSGLIAMVSAYTFSLFLGIDQAFLHSSFYIYNPLLVGFSIGYLFKLTPLAVALLIVASILTFVLTHLMQSIYSYYLRLPILSLPFVIVSSIVYLASSRYSNLLTYSLYSQSGSQWVTSLPYWVTGLCKSLGAILFIPNVWAGMLFLGLLLISSRILFVLVILGYYTGTFITAAMTGNIPDAFANINHFNYIWIAIAVGGIFLIPSLRSYVLAVVAVSTSTLVLHAVEVYWAGYGISAFALPFNLVSLSFIYVLGITGFPLMAKYIRETPEDTLDHYISTTRRFSGTVRTLSLPFAGSWLVWQGFNSKWTHQGSWQYAYDFVITDEEGSTYHDIGQQLEDYYAFRKPVLAPGRGRVTKVINNLPDNPIGRVDKTNNWGNLIVIYDPRGFWVELSHFKQDSIRVKEGDWIEQGTLLGLCGNSGYSPQPHIHVQVQSTEQIGSATLPFSFISYISDDRFYANAQPKEGTIVKPLPTDISVQNRMSFTLDQQFDFDFLKNGKKTTTCHLTVKMASDGSFYLDSGKAKLFFGHYEGTFYFYHMEGQDPCLQLLFLALPRMPMAHCDQLTWEDYVPVGILCRGIRKAGVLFLSSFYHDFNKVQSVCRYTSRRVIEGIVNAKALPIQGQTLVELDEYHGFKRIQFGDMELRQVIPVQPKEKMG